MQQRQTLRRIKQFRSSRTQCHVSEKHPPDPHDDTQQMKEQQRISQKSISLVRSGAKLKRWAGQGP